jgi:hypothetical protein
MTTYDHYRAIKELERQADRLGFELGPADHHYGGTQYMVLRPKSVEDTAVEPLPIFSRDASLFAGTIEELTANLTGWQRAFEYLQMVGAAPRKRIDKFEQNYRNRKLMDLLSKAQEDKKENG